MKKRIGFVSNSSASSFVLSKSVLTDEQLDAILNHTQYARENFERDETKIYDPIFDFKEYDEWFVVVDGDEVMGYTWMTNFGMEEFFARIGVPADSVEWGGGYDDEGSQRYDEVRIRENEIRLRQ